MRIGLCEAVLEGAIRLMAGVAGHAVGGQAAVGPQPLTYLAEFAGIARVWLVALRAGDQFRVNGVARLVPAAGGTGIFRRARVLSLGRAGVAGVGRMRSGHRQCQSTGQSNGQSQWFRFRVHHGSPPSASGFAALITAFKGDG